MSENKHTPEPWDNRTYIDRFWSRVNVSGENTTYLEDYDLTDIAERVRAGEWRKFVKEV